PADLGHDQLHRGVVPPARGELRRRDRRRRGRHRLRRPAPLRPGCRLTPDLDMRAALPDGNYRPNVQLNGELMSELLQSYVGGRWVTPPDEGTPLLSAVDGSVVARLS